MNRTQEEKLKQLAGELAQDVKTGEDLSSLSANPRDKLVKVLTDITQRQLSLAFSIYYGYYLTKSRLHIISI